MDYSSLSRITLILCVFMPILPVLHVFLLLILHFTRIFADDFAHTKAPANFNSFCISGHHQLQQRGVCDSSSMKFTTITDYKLYITDCGTINTNGFKNIMVPGLKSYSC